MIAIFLEQRVWRRGRHVLARQSPSAILPLVNEFETTIVAREAHPEENGLELPSQAHIVTLPGTTASARLKSYWQGCKIVRRSTAVAVFAPGVLGSIAGWAAVISRRPLIAFVVGDARAVARSIDSNMVGTLALRLIGWSTKRLTRRATIVQYVTTQYLQRSYPPGPRTKTFAATDTVIPRIQDRSERANSTGSIKLLAVGTMDQPYKGFSDLINAVSTVQSEGLRILLTIVGTGQLYDQYHEQAERECVPGSVIFTGSAFGSSLDALYTEADALVISSYTEGMPRVALEAAARGTLVLATNVGGLGELVSPDFRCQPRSARALAQLIRRLATSDAAVQSEHALQFARLHAMKENQVSVQTALVNELRAKGI